MVKKCISCNNKKYLRLYQKSSYLKYPVYKCIKCGLVFLYSEDDDIKEKNEEYYSRDYWTTIKKKSETRRFLINRIIGILRMFGTHPLQQYWHLGIIKKYSQNNNFKKLLEIGCGKGDTLKYFSNIGFEVTGIEPHIGQAKKINNWFRKKVCIAGFAEDIKLNDKFDIIYMCHVFEHLIRPDIFINKIKKNLNENGVIFLEVPNCDNKNVLYDSLNLPHVYSFTPKSIKTLFENNGFQVLKIGTYLEIHKSYLVKISKMLFKKNNYRDALSSKGVGLYLLASLNPKSI